MHYLKIFDEITDIMRNDYSGCIDKRGRDNPRFYRAKIETLMTSGRMTKKKFLDLVWEYLLSFKDYHIYAVIKGVSDTGRGIVVRRYGDKLYVVFSINPDFQKGDAIIKLGADSIQRASKRYYNYFIDTQAEREDWHRVLRKYRVCTVIKETGETVKRKFCIKMNCPKQETPKYSARKLNDDTLYIELLDFEDEKGIKNIIDKNLDNLENCKNLIIDVRNNGGGFDTAFFPLLEYIFDESITLSDLYNSGASDISINYSRRNCNGRLKMFEEFKKTCDENTKRYLLTAIKELKENFGKGLMKTEITEDEIDIKIKGQKTPENVIVLTDNGCGSSGDSFVEMCKQSKKVTVIGRPTLGSTDYSNLNIEEIDLLTLYYPTSRDGRIDSGKGINGKGVEVDIYVPWTPEHLKKDVDLEVALEFLHTKEIKK